MQSHKVNYRLAITIYLVIALLIIIGIGFAGIEATQILLLTLGIIVVSLVIQLVMYLVKPASFKNKQVQEQGTGN